MNAKLPAGARKDTMSNGAVNEPTARNTEPSVGWVERPSAKLFSQPAAPITTRKEA
jgi:hypothetical protein